MYERTYGNKYDRNLDVAEIAKRIRKEIAADVKAGHLPADWKYSVRIERFAGGRAIRINATSPVAISLCAPGYYAAGPEDRDLELPINGEWRNCRIRANDQWNVSRTDAQVAGVGWVHDVLQAKLNAYNHDGSDIMTDYFDVNFYSSVNLRVEGGWQNEYQRTIPYYSAARVA